MADGPRWRALLLVHPYPSGLNAAVTGGLVVLAGGMADRALQLGASMLLLQFAIGAANDWADAAADAVVRPAKPIPAGLLARGQAAAIAVVSAAAGLLLAAAAGPPVLAVALAGLLAGLAYDLALKGTAWAWLPFSAGFALLPLFAWLGGVGAGPPFLGWIVLLALPAGGAVALANGLVDLEGDRQVGRRGPAVRLGGPRTVRVLFALHALLVGGVAASLLLAGGAPLGVWLGIGLGGGFIGVGRALSAGAARERRLTGWRAQAFGLAALAGSWFVGMANR